MNAIETDALTKQYGSVTAIRDVTMTVPSGEIFGFLGPNGAGKSTTIACLLDYVRPTAGSARIFGMDPRQRQVEIGRAVGILPERCELYDRLSGRKHLAFAIRAMDVADDPDELLDRVGLDGAGSRTVGTYSTGMTQRLKLALALVGAPKLLILDEPSSGLDPNGIKRLREIVTAERERGTTVFFSSHVLEQVEAVCDRIGIMVDGRLAVSGDLASLHAELGPTLQLSITVDAVPSSLERALESMAAVEEWRISRSGSAGVPHTSDRPTGGATVGGSATGGSAVGGSAVDESTVDESAVGTEPTSTAEPTTDDKPSTDPATLVVSIAGESEKAAVLRRVEKHATVLDFSAERRSIEALFQRYAWEER